MPYINAAHDCIDASCSAADATAAHADNIANCQSYGINILTVLSATTSATTAAVATAAAVTVTAGSNNGATQTQGSSPASTHSGSTTTAPQGLFAN